MPALDVMFLGTAIVGFACLIYAVLTLVLFRETPHLATLFLPPTYMMPIWSKPSSPVSALYEH
jgi:hypothetical protein